MNRLGAQGQATKDQGHVRSLSLHILQIPLSQFNLIWYYKSVGGPNYLYRNLRSKGQGHKGLPHI